MATIKFLLQSNSTTAGIYVRLKDGRLIDIKAKTNFIVNSEDWSKIKGQPKNLKSENFKKLDADLNKIRLKLLDHYNNSQNKLEIDSQWLKDFINPPKKAAEITNKLLEYYDYYALHKKNEVTPATLKKLNVQKHLIGRFQLDTKTEYLIKDVNSQFKLKFEEYCYENNYSPNTIAQVIKSIKTVCYHAQSNGIDVSNQLANITVKKEKVDKIYLTSDELERIEKQTYELDRLENARDWLLISCETGQRVSDFMRFSKEMIRNEKNRQGVLKALIEFSQTKTGKIMSIPLSKRVINILKKRNGEFPNPISDQKYNDYIKEVCKIAGLTKKIQGSKIDPNTNRKSKGKFEKYELVTSHIGRRSFASNYYGIIPTSLLISATGHSTEKMFLEYIGKTDTQKAIELSEYI